jgi:hypothetical protein
MGLKYNFGKVDGCFSKILGAETQIKIKLRGLYVK